MWQKIFNGVKVFCVFIVVLGIGWYVFNVSGIELPKNFKFISFAPLQNATSSYVEKSSIIKLITPDTTPNLQFVSETEYQFGDGSGATIIKLTDHKGDKINTTCWEQILYPDKSVYVSWTSMIQQWEYGNYYMNFALPSSIIGIYDQEVRCLVSSKNVSLGKGFHLGNLTNVIDTKINTLKQDQFVSMS
jgi:hypothetical protein